MVGASFLLARSVYAGNEGMVSNDGALPARVLAEYRCSVSLEKGNT